MPITETTPSTPPSSVGLAEGEHARYGVGHCTGKPKREEAWLESGVMVSGDQIYLSPLYWGMLGLETPQQAGMSLESNIIIVVYYRIVSSCKKLETATEIVR